ncbi:hypothetical protein Afe04nite_38590 [Asanoa ferruginea]|nr:hypothetical protein Afe04nite_38590 [Asanoa ferruginea]
MVLSPHLASLQLQRVRLAASTVRVEAATTTAEAVCPDCGALSSRVHSRYVRRVADPGLGGREVRLDLTVRRFFCPGPSCPRRTFAEPVVQATRHAETQLYRTFPHPPWTTSLRRRSLLFPTIRAGTSPGRLDISDHTGSWRFAGARHRLTRQER